jgi:AcrR family transcriptional regulator
MSKTAKTPAEDVRKRLDQEQVFEAAEALVDRDGWRELTMTKLANELGVKVPSLYNHVPSLEALRGELQNRTLSQLGEALNRKAMGRAGEEAMRALAQTYRRFANEHPARYDLATQSHVDPDEFAVAAADAGGALAAVVRSYGIEDASIELQLSAFAALHGVLVLEHAHFFPDVIDTESVFNRVLEVVLTLLDEASSDQAKESVA